MTTINRITGYDLARFNADESLRVYQEVATKSAIYPGQGTPLGLAYCALKLNGEAGELAEHVGKAMRDDGLFDLVELDIHVPKEARYFSLEMNSLEPARKSLIIKEVGDVLWYLSSICNELGISLAEAAMINLEKLKDRTDRDALRGSGDER
jgi:NTP pyrophosphatase (non-canonical NTP hydrolase)